MRAMFLRKGLESDRGGDGGAPTNAYHQPKIYPIHPRRATFTAFGERRLTISNVLSFPPDNIENANDVVLLVLIQNTIQ